MTGVIIGAVGGLVLGLAVVASALALGLYPLWRERLRSIQHRKDTSE